MILQFCGLSGSGKTTLSYAILERLITFGYKTEVIDGDEYRKVLCPDLGFSRDDRNTNVRRLGFVASRLSKHGVIAIICAINPYEDVREEISANYPDVYTIYISCDLETLKQRDTKGLYRRAQLPNCHPEKLNNLTGVNDPFETPSNPDLILYTSQETVGESADRLMNFILSKFLK